MEQDDTKRIPGTAPSSQSEHWSQASARSNEIVTVRLVRKYADMIDGVNLENLTVGDRLDLSRRDAGILIAEGWAVPALPERRLQNLPRRASEERRVRSIQGRALAADRSSGPAKKSKP